MTVTVNFTGLEPIADAINHLAQSLGSTGFVTTVRDKSSATVAPVQPQATVPSTVQPGTQEPPEDGSPEPEQTCSLEEVRAKLAELNKSGKRAEVKALLAEFGAVKLSEVDSEQYGALMKKAEEL